MINQNLMQNNLIVTGADGRIGRALRAVWGGQVAGRRVLWSARRPGQGIDIPWNMGVEAAPALPSGSILLNLAGQTRGDASQLAENRRAAAALGRAACQAGVAHVFHMSSAAIYRPEAALIAEDTPPYPISDYGHAKWAAEQAMSETLYGCGLTILRLGNLAGADALLTSARNGPVALDPISGQPGGPERSYIGPNVLAATLTHLIMQAIAGVPMPAILNLAQHPALPMADLLMACGADWRFGKPRPAAIPRVALSLARLQACASVPYATAASIVADLVSLRGRWP